MNQYGIPNSHAYSVISAFYIKSSEKLIYKVYMIRNPWSTSNYKGMWNAKDKLWKNLSFL
jgi:hypothetical protein